MKASYLLSQRCTVFGSPEETPVPCSQFESTTAKTILIALQQKPEDVYRYPEYAALVRQRQLDDQHTLHLIVSAKTDRQTVDCLNNSSEIGHDLFKKCELKDGETGQLLEISITTTPNDAENA